MRPRPEGARIFMSDPTLVKARPATNTKTITTLAMLSAIAFVVMLVSKLLPSVNGFLDFDFKDVVICIGGFVFGPMAAASMAVVVAFVEMITVSHTGIIGFVGLVAPHIARFLMGGDHRYLLPFSALCGSILVLVADTVGRVAFSPTTLPVGIVVSYVGVPLFLYLILRERWGRA